MFEKSGDSLQEIPFGFSAIRTEPSSIAGETFVYFKFSRTQLKGKDPSTLKWSLLFIGPGDFQTIQSPDAPSGGTAAGTTTSLKDIFSPAKTRDDADLYISGSILAVKAQSPYICSMRSSTSRTCQSNRYSSGVYGEIQSNTSATPPNDRSSIDRDSITAAATINQLHNSFYWELKPAGGEFSRKYPESNFVSSGTIAWWPKATPVPGGWLTSAVYRLRGGNESQQAYGFVQQPADLSHYNAITRIVPTIPITYYVWG